MGKKRVNYLLNSPGASMNEYNNHFAATTGPFYPLIYDRLLKFNNSSASVIICIAFTITGFIHFTICGAKAQGFEFEGRHYPYFAKSAPGSARFPAGPVCPCK